MMNPMMTVMTIDLGETSEVRDADRRGVEIVFIYGKRSYRAVSPRRWWHTWRGSWGRMYM
jgi:hypothetical protein